jgi:hypothetical protein
MACLLDGLESALPVHSRLLPDSSSGCLTSWSRQKTLDLSNMPEITEQKLCEALSENPGTEYALVRTWPQRLSSDTHQRRIPHRCLQLAGAIDAKMLICVEKFFGATLVEFSLAGERLDQFPSDA